MSSGRYQSRLFNFVHQQSRRLTEQWEYTYRHLEVATKWSMELLLYPVYLLFQSSESSGKTLHTKKPQTRLKLQPNDPDFQPETLPNVDSPIQNVLEAVHDLSFDEAVSTPAKISESFKPLALLGAFRLKFVDNNANFTQSSNITLNKAGSLKQHFPVVRGIATNLLNRRLVLVTADNEILDILTSQQQAKLEDRIINEVAKYWQFWRLIIAKKETDLLPQIDRLLAKLTDGNTIKIPLLAEGIPKDLLHTDRLLEFLDIAVAKLESNALVPVQERSQEIVQVAQTQLNIFLYGKEQLTARGEIATTADGLETHTLNLQALIEAALNYFFGVGNRKIFEPTISDEPLTTTSISPSSKRANLWLTWSDLFDDKPVPLAQNKSSALPSSFSFPENNLAVKQPKIESGLVQRKQPNSNLAPIKKTSRKVASATQTQASISQPKSESYKGEILQGQFHQSSQVEAQQDWIETKATSTGYEKHPLEQLLEWLDYIMLWLEERFVKIFQSLRQLWQGK